LYGIGKSLHKFYIFLSVFLVFGPVRWLAATAQSESSIIVTWEPPDEGGGAIEFKNYRVTSTLSIRRNTTETSIIINNLNSNAHYDIDVASMGMDDRLGASIKTEAITRMLLNEQLVIFLFNWA